MTRKNHQTPFQAAFAAAVLLVAGTVCLQAQSQSEGVIAQSAENDFRRSLVRVELAVGFSGVMLGDRYVPEIEVEEKVEYWGAVIDQRGLIALQASGLSLFQLEAKNLKAAILSAHGHYRWPADLLGIDKRTELVILHSDEFQGRDLPLTDTLEAAPLYFAVFSGQQWRLETHRLSALQAEKDLPEWTVAIPPSNLAGDTERLVGSYVLNQEGKLAGLVTRYKPELSNREKAVYRVLPASNLLASARRISETRRSIEAGWLGVVIDNSSGQAMLVDVTHGSPADKAGLKVGDALLKVGPRGSNCLQDLGLAIRWKGAGSKLDLTIARSGKVRSLSALLQERRVEDRIWAVDITEGLPPERPRPSPAQLRYQMTQLFALPQLGVILEPLNARSASKYKVPVEKGLIIRYLSSHSPAHHYFRSGDVIFRINGRKLCCVSEVHTALPNSPGGKMVIEFYRGGELQKVTVNAVSWARSKN